MAAILAAVQSRYKQDVVTALNFVRLFALKLPVCIVDQDQDARAAVACGKIRTSALSCRTGPQSFGGVRGVSVAKAIQGGDE